MTPRPVEARIGEVSTLRVQNRFHSGATSEHDLFLGGLQGALWGALLVLVGALFARCKSCPAPASQNQGRYGKHYLRAPCPESLVSIPPTGSYDPVRIK